MPAPHPIFGSLDLPCRPQPKFNLGPKARPNSARASPRQLTVEERVALAFGGAAAPASPRGAPPPPPGVPLRVGEPLISPRSARPQSARARVVNREYAVDKHYGYGAYQRSPRKPRPEISYVGKKEQQVWMPGKTPKTSYEAFGSTFQLDPKFLVDADGDGDIDEADMQVAGPIGMAAFADGGGPAWWRKEIDKLNKTPAERGAELKKSMQYSDGAPRNSSAQFFGAKFRPQFIGAKFRRNFLTPLALRSLPQEAAARLPADRRPHRQVRAPARPRLLRGRQLAEGARRQPAAVEGGARQERVEAAARHVWPDREDERRDLRRLRRAVVRRNVMINHALKIQPGLRMLPSRSSWRPSGSVRSTSSSTRAGGGGAASFARCAGKSSRQ